MNSRSTSVSGDTMRHDNAHANKGNFGLMTLAEASKTLPKRNGKRVHTSTIFRWCRRGCNGVFLKYAKIGRTIVVTESELNSFFGALAAADNVSQPSHALSRKRKPRHANSATRQQAINNANEVLLRAEILKPQPATTY